MMYLLFIALGFASTLLSGVFGFGSAMIILAIGPYLIPAHQVVVLSAIMFGVSTLTKTVIFRAHLRWTLVAYIALGSLPFAYVGGRLLPYLSQTMLKRCLGTMILIYVGLQVTTLFRPEKVTPPKKHNASNNSASSKRQSPGKLQLITVAASYGFMSGLIGSGGIIKAVFLRELRLSKEAFVGTMAATSVLATLGKTLAYFQSGLLQAELALPVAGLIVAAVTAALVGKYCLARIDSDIFNKGIYLLLTAAGIGLLL